jgi:hypothetical protein
MGIDIKTAEALTSQETRETLALFRNLPDDPLAIQKSFRGMFPEKLARAMVDLRLLRRRAAQKFERGMDMFFTKPLLEQSSSEVVARYRAARFAGTGTKVVLDPCCGMGSDAIALAAAGLRVEAADEDAVAVHFARVNAEVYGLNGQLTVQVADCEQQPPAGGAAIFLDPARRRGARRLVNPAEWSPSPKAVSAMLAGRLTAAVKLSPAVELEELLTFFPPPDEIEVISYLGEAKETVFWYGAAAGKEPRRATILPCGESFAGPAHPQAEVGPLGKWIFDPDPALVRAGLLGGFATQHGLKVLDPEIGYLTGPKRVKSPFVDAFKVVDEQPLDPRKMRAALRDHGVGELLIRKRGIAERPQTLSQRFLPKPFGTRRMTLLAVRLGDRHVGILGEAAE